MTTPDPDATRNEDEVDHDADFDDEKVYVTARRTGEQSQDKVYHTDADCRHLTDRSYPWPRSGAEDWGLRECRWCSGEFEPTGCGNDHSEPLLEIGEMIDDPSQFTAQEMIDLYNETRA